MLAPMTLAQSNDQDLYQQLVSHGSEQALDALLKRHWSELFRLAYAVTKDSALAEDAAQEAFLKLHHKASHKEPLNAPRPWLRQVTLNLARTKLRSEHRRSQREQDFARSRPQHTKLNRSPGAALTELLQSLPDTLRLPLELHFGLGLSHREVSESLDCPIGTASSRIRLGLEKLREGLKAHSIAPATALTSLLSEQLRKTSPSPQAPNAKALLKQQSSLILGASLTPLIASGFVALSLLGLGLLLTPDDRPTPPARQVKPAKLATANSAADKSKALLKESKVFGKPGSLLRLIERDSAPKRTPKLTQSQPEVTKPGPSEKAVASTANVALTSFRGQVVDKQGRGIPDAELIIGVHGKGGQLHKEGLRTRTDRDGFYHFGQVPTNKAGALLVSKPGFIDHFRRLRGEQSGPVVDITLERSMTLMLRLKDQQGRDLQIQKPVRVLVTAPDESYEENTQATKDGYQRFTGLPEQRLATLKLRVITDGWLPVDLPPSRDFERRDQRLYCNVTLVRGASLTGLATDPLGRPLSNAQIHLKVPGYNLLDFLSSSTDAQGRFTITGLPAGQFQLSGHHKQLRVLMKKLVIRKDEHHEVNLVFREGRRLKLHIVDENGDPLALRFTVNRDVFHDILASQTNEAGVAEVKGLSLTSREFIVNFESQLEVFEKHIVQQSPNSLEIRLKVKLTPLPKGFKGQTMASGFDLRFPED